MQKVLILDFGGQHDQLLARRVRECHVYCEVHPAAKATVQSIRGFDPIGIILTGSASSIHDESPQVLPQEVFELGIPILGISYGCQLMAHQLGGSVTKAPACDTPREFGRTLTHLDTDCPLFLDLPADSITWLAQLDCITRLPEGFVSCARTEFCANTAICCPEKNFYGVQFHPEVTHTYGGVRMLRGFLYQICGAVGDWSMEGYIQESVRQLRERIGSKKVLLALSGGVDSSVAAALLNRAVGSQLTCIFVDHGMLRADEGDQVESLFSHMALQFVRINAADQFLESLQGVTDPAIKRQVIDREFSRILKAEAAKLGHVDFLAQGTIYPDVIDTLNSATEDLKSHHKIDALPDHTDFQAVIEPLRLLFKDEVRELGRAMGLPEPLLNRQPFPGPGLAIRIMGQVTAEKLEILRQADFVFRTELEKAHLDRSTSQYFAVLTNTHCHGCVCQYALALRAVTTDDFMTAKFARIPYELLDKISGEILRRVSGISRIVYDITSKPPASIEWE